jgi:hypothetical protein
VSENPIGWKRRKSGQFTTEGEIVRQFSISFGERYFVLLPTDQFCKPLAVSSCLDRPAFRKIGSVVQVLSAVGELPPKLTQKRLRRVDFALGNLGLAKDSASSVCGEGEPMSLKNDELAALACSFSQVRTLPDADLLAALCAGCNDALTVPFERHSALAFRTARAVLRDGGEVEETVQRVFLDIFRAARRFNSETTPRRHELLIEILKFLTPALALVSSLVALTGRYSWLSKLWLFDAAVVLGVLILLWFAKPRLEVWLQRIRGGKSDQRFIASKPCASARIVGATHSFHIQQ